MHHNNPVLSCHRKFSKTLALINKNYYVHGLSKILKSYLETCHVCRKLSKFADSRNRTPVGLSSAKSANAPMDYLMIDFFDLPMKSPSFSYCLLCQDEFSSYIWSVPCKNADAKTAAVALANIFDKFGHCIHLSSDRGNHFLANINNELKEIFGYDHVFDATKNPRGTGLVERSVGEMKKIIRNHIAANPSMSIPKIIEHATISYNATPHESLDNLTPFFCFFKRDYRSALDSVLNPDKQIFEPTHIVAKEIKKDVTLKNSLIKKAHLNNRENRKFLNDVKLDEITTYKAGDEVFLEETANPLNQKLGRKSQIEVTGPWIILYTTKNLAVLADADGKIRGDLISIRRLIPAQNLDKSMQADTINHLIEGVIKTKKTRQKNSGNEYLYYPIIEGKICKQSAFWF